MFNLVRSDRESRWGNWGQVEPIFLRFDIAGGEELRLCGEATRKPAGVRAGVEEKGLQGERHVERAAGSTEASGFGNGGLAREAQEEVAGLHPKVEVVSPGFPELGQEAKPSFYNDDCFSNYDR
jgi:hypothetical protein